MRNADERGKTHRVNTCNDCNRKFCLDYNLPGCRGVKEEDVFTTCFRTTSSHVVMRNLYIHQKAPTEHEP